MNSLVLINEKDNLRAYYYLKEVEKISYGKMKDFRNESDILANDHKKMKVRYIYFLQMIALQLMGKNGISSLEHFKR